MEITLEPILIVAFLRFLADIPVPLCQLRLTLLCTLTVILLDEPLDFHPRFYEGNAGFGSRELVLPIVSRSVVPHIGTQFSPWASALGLQWRYSSIEIKYKMSHFHGYLPRESIL